MQQGVSLVLTTMLLTVLLGFFALAIDVGYLFVVRNQLQNAADTTALSAANYLYPLVKGDPNWSLAILKANSAIQQNKVDNISLAGGTINIGYWNITGAPTGLHATKLDLINDYPAIQVTITKAGANGVLSTYFAGVLGILSFSPSATAVAVGGLSPGYTKENILPFVIPGCMFGLGANGSGVLTYPVGEFHTDSPYGSSGSNCNTGQWTSQKSTKDQSDKTMQDLINALKTGEVRSTLFSIGDAFFLQSGSEANLYKMINDCSVAGNGTCGYVTAAITCPLIGLCDGVLTDTVTQIVGFVCVMVVNANGKSTPKYITYQIVSQNDPNYKSNCMMHDSGGIGPSGGATMPPKLVNYWGNIY